MKAKDGRKIIEQIVSVRSRLRFERREAELFARLSAIESSYERMDPAIPALLRYYPTALVACVESYFRLAIKELIDSGEPYLNNSLQLLRREGYDFDCYSAPKFDPLESRDGSSSGRRGKPCVRC